MLCSRAGIARMPGGEVYITESCIGCGICAERCPYDNISIMTLTEEVNAPPTWQRFSNFFTKGAGRERGRKSLTMLQSAAAPGPQQDQRHRHFDDHKRPLDAVVGATGSPATLYSSVKFLGFPRIPTGNPSP